MACAVIVTVLSLTFTFTAPGVRAKAVSFGPVVSLQIAAAAAPGAGPATTIAVVVSRTATPGSATRRPTARRRDWMLMHTSGMRR